MRSKKKTEEKWPEHLYKKAEALINNPEYAADDLTHLVNGSYCKIWLKTIAEGYPKMHIDGYNMRGHVIACAIGNNYTRVHGLEAAHECGQPHCVNPLHLKFKTHKENMIDKVKHGSNNNLLPWDVILEIRERCAHGEKQYVVARICNTSPSNVSLIVRNKNRKNG